MTNLNLRQHHGIVTGANTDNKAVSQNEIANGIGYKSEITSENLNAFFQRNDTSIDTLVSLIMQTIRTDNTNIEPNALIESIKMHGQSTYYYDGSIMTNMQVGDRFSDYLGNVYQVHAGKIIYGIVCDNAGHQIVYAGKPLPAKISDIRNYINHLPDRYDYALGYNLFARRMSGSAFQVKKIVGNKRHTTWQNVNITTTNAIEVAKHISDGYLEQIMRLPIIDNNSRIITINQVIQPEQIVSIRGYVGYRYKELASYSGLAIYQPPLSFQVGHNGSDINTADGYLNELTVSGNDITFKRYADHNMPINIKKISLINL